MAAAAHIRARVFSFVVALMTATIALPTAGAQQPGPAATKPLPHKDPTAATVYGILLPGAGQLYAERFGKAAAVFAGTAAAVAIAVDASHTKCTGSCGISPVQKGGIAVAVLIWGYGWATAAHDARMFNTQRLLNQSSLAPYLDRRNGRLLAGFNLEMP